MDWSPEDDEGKAYVTLAFSQCDPANEQDWERQRTLLAEYAGKFFHAFNPFVAKLDSPPMTEPSM